jgi:hypothetical protein
MKKIAMIRVGVDAGEGKIQGPLFRDGSYEYIPIPDGTGTDRRTYGNITGRNGRKLIEYFPISRQIKMKDQSVHFDPEFETFTYGDPTRPKASLRRLSEDDILVFYCGLEGWSFNSAPALYIFGYFEILVAGKAAEFSSNELKSLFGNNYHVMHKDIFREQKDDLVLVRGNSNSRLLKKAVLMSTMSQDRAGRPLKVLSPEMQKIFGDFNGKISFQRSPTRWVDPAFIETAYNFIMSLE